MRRNFVRRRLVVYDVVAARPGSEEQRFLRDLDEREAPVCCMPAIRACVSHKDWSAGRQVLKIFNLVRHLWLGRLRGPLLGDTILDG